MSHNQHILIQAHKKGAKSVIYKIDDKGCWICISHAINNKGYILTGRNKKTIRLHRLVYETFKGIIPENYCIRHTCDVKCCINPEHLITGTHRQNMEDAKQRKLLESGEDSHKAKITNKQALEIFNSNLPNTILAKLYGIDASTCSRIKHKKRWLTIHN